MNIYVFWNLDAALVHYILTSSDTEVVNQNILAKKVKR